LTIKKSVLCPTKSQAVERKETTVNKIEQADVRHLLAQLAWHHNRCQVNYLSLPAQVQHRINHDDALLSQSYNQLQNALMNLMISISDEIKNA
jgi:hypothetical protein